VLLGSKFSVLDFYCIRGKLLLLLLKLGCGIWLVLCIRGWVLLSLNDSMTRSYIIISLVIVEWISNALRIFSMKSNYSASFNYSKNIFVDSWVKNALYHSSDLISVLIFNKSLLKSEYASYGINLAQNFKKSSLFLSFIRYSRGRVIGLFLGLNLCRKLFYGEF